MDNRPPFENPLDVRQADGAIVLTGPNGLSAALTPEAAMATAQRLLEAVGGEGLSAALTPQAVSATAKRRLHIAEGEGSPQIYQKPLG